MTTAQILDILAAVPLPALVIDANQRIAEANADALTLLGQGIKGRHFTAILRQPEMIDTIEGALADRRPRKAEYLTNDGAHDIVYEVTCRPVDALGGIMLSFQDTTHLHQAGQMRRDFVANVSHELRTPLTALMGFIETLRGAASKDETARERFLTIMDAEASRMNRLVGDLLSLSRVESEERVRPREPVNLSGLLASVLNSLRPLGEAANVAFVKNVPEAEVTLPGDADQLRQVFTNLIENAIKYGGSGGRVTVSLSVAERDPALRAPAARVQVTDQGPGIDPRHLPRLTERFYRADSHRSRQLGGTGLGLAIVKHIVNRHRGRLRVESELGKGASFTVILPTSAPTQAD
jgi:two-component system phosphate regulon sensor histidine kinase PhoR